MLGVQSEVPEIPDLPTFKKSAAFMHRGPPDLMETVLDRIHYGKVDAEKLVPLFIKEIEKRKQ